MPATERAREHRSDLPTREEMEDRLRDGWRLAAVEWERGGEGTGPAAAPGPRREIPYGLRPSDDGHYLEDDEREAAIMRRVLAGLVEDCPLGEIAAELNESGSRTRGGGPWRQTDLFDLLPRIVEAGAEILRSDAWAEDRAARRALSAALAVCYANCGRH